MLAGFFCCKGLLLKFMPFSTEARHSLSVSSRNGAWTHRPEEFAKRSASSPHEGTGSLERRVAVTLMVSFHMKILSSSYPEGTGSRVFAHRTNNNSLRRTFLLLKTLSILVCWTRVTLASPSIHECRISSAGVSV